MLCLTVGGCLPAAERPFSGPDPSDPSVRVQALGYRPVLGGYVSLRPVEPASWRERNDRVAPAERR
jgi:hypothetical protein